MAEPEVPPELGALARRVLALVACAALVVLLALSAPPWPDDWDGLGFLAAATRFDMDHFAPHPPGYPVYVALLHVARLLAGDSRLAAYAVAIAGGVASAVLGASAMETTFGARARWPAALAVVATPLAWRAMSAIGTESLALAVFALGAWALVAARRGDTRAPVILGLAVGAGLGVRLSWAPLYASLLVLAPRGTRVKAALSALGALALWAVPFVAIVGPRHVLDLYRTHAVGHASRWGGTALSDPGPARGIYFARDLVVDGLGVDLDALGFAIAFAALALAALGLRAWHRASWRGAGAVLVMVLPYALWIAVGQNLRQQPRHALPLVVALGLGLGRAAMVDRRAKVVGILLFLLVAARTGEDAFARRTTAPPGAQVVLFARGLPVPRDARFFGGPSARFFEPTELAEDAMTVGTLGEAKLALTRMDRLPKHVFVTSELEGGEVSAYPLDLRATLCRPPRIDRRAPCLSVYEWKLPYLPR